MSSEKKDNEKETMGFQVPPEMERRIIGLIDRGIYNSKSEAIRALIWKGLIVVEAEVGMV